METVTDPARRLALARRAEDLVDHQVWLRREWIRRTDATVMPAVNDTFLEEDWCQAFDAFRAKAGGRWFSCDASVSAGGAAVDLFELGNETTLLNVSDELFSHHVLIFDPEAERAVLATMDDYALIAGDREFIDGVFGSFDAGAKAFDDFLASYEAMFQGSELYDRIVPRLIGVAGWAREGAR